MLYVYIYMFVKGTVKLFFRFFLWQIPKLGQIIRLAMFLPGFPNEVPGFLNRVTGFPNEVNFFRIGVPGLMKGGQHFYLVR